MRNFLLLMLANMLLVAVVRLGWEWQPGPKLHAQSSINGDKIQLLKDGEPQTEPSQAASAPVATGRTRSNFHLAMSISSPVAAPSNELVCMEWGEFTGPDIKKVAAVLAEMKLGNNLEKRELDELRRYWVYLPPQPNKAGVNRKISQLKDRGINDYFVVQKPGNWHNAISLGVFKTREAADNFLADLQVKRDVHTARAGEWFEKQPATTFVLKNVDASIAASVAAMQKDYKDVELKNIPCIH